MSTTATVPVSTTATVPGPRPVTLTPARDNAGGRPPGGTRPGPQGHPRRAGLAALASLAINFAARCSPTT